MTDHDFRDAFGSAPNDQLPHPLDDLPGGLLPAENHDPMETTIPEDNMATFGQTNADDDVEMTAPTVEAAEPALDLGNSMFSKPKASGDHNGPSMREKMLAAQQKMMKAMTEREQTRAANDEQQEEPEGAGSAEEVDSRSPSPAPKGRGKGKRDPVATHFNKLKAAFQRKQKAGVLTMHDEIEFMKAETDFRAHERKQQDDDEFDREPSEEDDGTALFLSTERRQQAAAPPFMEMYSDDDESEDDSSKKKRKKPTKKGKGKGKRPASDDEDDEDESDEPPPKKRRGRAPKASGPRKKAAKVPGTSYTDHDLETVLQKAKKGEVGARGPGRKKGVKATDGGKRKAGGPQMTNVNSIMGTQNHGCSRCRLRHC
jgi:hypothetical protein